MAVVANLNFWEWVKTGNRVLGANHMAYVIELKMKHEYVKLTYLGTVTRSVLARSLEDIYYVLITNGLYKIFIDITQGKMIMSPTDMYVLIRMIRSDFLMSASIAVYVRPDQMEMVRFIENSSYNRIDLKGCTDKDTVHNWLKRRARVSDNPLGTQQSLLIKTSGSSHGTGPWKR